MLEKLMDTDTKTGTEISIGDGARIDLANPVLELPHIEMLLWNSAKVNRFGGRGAGTIPVLHHSIHVADLVEDPHSKKLAILHDLHEVPFGEMPTPAKRVIGEDLIKQATDRFDQAMFRCLGLDFGAAEYVDVKCADTKALITEKDWLEIDPGDDWGTGHVTQLAELKMFDFIRRVPTDSLVNHAMGILEIPQNA